MNCMNTGVGHITAEKYLATHMDLEDDNSLENLQRIAIGKRIRLYSQLYSVDSSTVRLSQGSMGIIFIPCGAGHTH